MAKFTQTYNFDTAFNRTAKEMAEGLKKDVKANWSRGTSSAGSPPARQSGDLDKSIYSRVVSSGVRDKVIVGSDEDYAFALEFGTVNMSPRPFLRPALSKAVKYTKNMIK